MSKKLKITMLLVGAVFLSLTIFSVYYRYATEKEIVSELNTKSQDFIGKWGNYTDSSDKNYLDLLKLYLSDNEYRAMEEEANTVREYIGAGYEPNVSRVIINGCSTSKEPGGYISICDINQEIIDYKKTDLTMRIYWEKFDDSYLINDWYTE